MSADDSVEDAPTLDGSGTYRMREAEPFLLEAYAIISATRGPEGRGAVKVVESLVRVYEGTGRPAEAATWRRRLGSAK